MCPSVFFAIFSWAEEILSRYSRALAPGAAPEHFYVFCGTILHHVRKVDMLDDISILRSEKAKDELILDDNDIELVSRSAALINQVKHHLFT
ncbi:60S ribosomal protein L9 [Platanthera zijinensis]|uniref:60S ribosomal protein L9 n=1 Tax=Platanthera zijinensis TaxID=2320716 RepID=A0AAP0BM95_9ASPA